MSAGGVPASSGRVAPPGWAVGTTDIWPGQRPSAPSAGMGSNRCRSCWRSGRSRRGSAGAHGFAAVVAAPRNGGRGLPRGLLPSARGGPIVDAVSAEFSRSAPGYGPSDTRALGDRTPHGGPKHPLSTPTARRHADDRRCNGNPAPLTPIRLAWIRELGRRVWRERAAGGRADLRRGSRSRLRGGDSRPAGLGGHQGELRHDGDVRRGELGPGPADGG